MDFAGHVLMVIAILLWFALILGALGAFGQPYLVHLL